MHVVIEDCIGSQKKLNSNAWIASKIFKIKLTRHKINNNRMP